MNCPNCNQPMSVVGDYWVCGQHDPPVHLSVDSATTFGVSSDLGDVDLSALPYPVALTAGRLRQAIESSADVLKTLFVLKDCFEAAVKYLGAVLVTDYLRSPARKPERNETLLERMVRPSLGVWVQTVVGDVSRWLAADGQASLPVVAIFVRREGRSTKPKPTPLLRQCEEFVGYRNDALGHGALRRESVYLQDLERWLPVLQHLLEAVTDLAGWRLCLVTDQDRCQLWMGTDLQTTIEPGSFQREQIGHFLLRGPESTTCDLYPFLCYLPDAEGEQRLHFYDSIYRYQETRKEVSVLEYDNGLKHASSEPVSGLEQAFTTELLKKAFQRHQGRMEVIEGRVASFGELLVEHADIVGRRFVIDHVQRFIEEHDRGLMVIQAEPGKGKTALMCHLIEDVFGGYTPQPVHFFYRRTAGITDPDVCVRSLYHALLQTHDITENEDSQRQTSPDEVYEKLTNLLADSIAPRLSPSRPQLILIDALDESDKTAASRTAFDRIPENLPAGVYVIATTRPVSDRATLARRAHLHWYDLDSPDLLQDNLRDGAEYVHRELVGSDLPNDAFEEISRLGNANFLVLKLLVTQVQGRLESNEVREYVRRLAAGCGQDQLGFIYQEFWTRLTNRLDRGDTNLLCDVAGLLVTARAPLTREVICCSLGLRDGDWDFALRHLSEYLTVIEQHEDNVRETYYRIYHESFADFLRSRVIRQRERYEGLLADYCLDWSDLAPGRGRLYALRFARTHLLAVRRYEEMEALLLDFHFLEAKIEAGMVFDLVGDFSAARAALPEDRPDRHILRLLEEALRRDVHFIARHAEDYPQALFQCLWNTCWWYDSPVVAGQDAQTVGDGQGTSQSSQCELRLHQLLESWRATKELAAPGFAWVRSLRPPMTSLAAGLEEAVFRGHEGEVTAVAMSSDGRSIASSSADGTVRVWDADTGKDVHCLRADGMAWNTVAFSPDGRRIAAGSDVGRVQIWNADSGVLLQSFDFHGRAIACLAFSPDGQMIVMGSRGTGMVWLWGIRSDEPLWERQGHHSFEIPSLPFSGGNVLGVAFSPNGRYIASGGLDGKARIWDAKTGQELLLLHVNSPVGCVTFAPDGRYIVTASDDRSIRIWESATGEWESTSDARLSHSLSTRDRRIFSVGFSPDGRRLVAGGLDDGAFPRIDGVVQIWDVEAWVELCCFTEPADVNSVAICPNGQRVVSGSLDGTIRVWNVDRDQDAGLPRPESSGWVGSIAFSPDGRKLVFVDSIALHVCDTNDGVELWSLPQQHCSVRIAAFSPDDRLVASGGFEGALRVCDAETGEELWSSRSHEGLVRALSFSPDGRLLATGGFDRTIRLWDWTSGQEVACLRGHQGRVTKVLFSPDSRLVASTCDANSLRVWNVGDGKEVWCFWSPKWTGFSIATSNDGQYFVSANATDREPAQVIDATERRHIYHEEASDLVAILSVAFSHDSRQIVAGCDDGGVRVWDLLDRGVERRRFTGHRSPVRNVAFSPSGKRIVSASTNEETRVWDTTRGGCIEVIEGNGDVCAIAIGRERFPQRALSRGLETIIECAGTAKAVACLPMPVESITTNTSGRIWGGSTVGGVCVFKLEGIDRGSNT